MRPPVDTPLKAGIVGLGMAGNMFLRAIEGIPDLAFVAAADLRENALAAFREHYKGKIYLSVEGLCADPDVEAVWVATPTALHCKHAVMLAEAGKHVVVEKPMAVSLDECDQMIEAARRNNVVLIAGGAHSLDPAFIAMRNVITSGRLGRVAALADWSFTTWMTRPREPQEVDVNQGGGAIYNQAAHPIDVLRLLGGGLVRSVRGMTADTALRGRPCPGYFTAAMEFEDGTPATFVYNGYGYLNSWELLPWGETPGRLRAADANSAYRRALRAGTADEYEAKELRRYGGRPVDSGVSAREDSGWTPSDAGLVIATCEYGEIRQSKDGLFVYDDDGRHDEPLTSGGPSMRQNEISELRDAISGRRRPLHDGYWGKATTEVLVSLIRSAAEHKDVVLQHQVPVQD